MRKFSRRMALGLIAVAHSAAAEVDTSALERKYSALKARYEALKQSAVDLSSLSSSIEALKAAVKTRKGAEVSALLDQLDQKLRELELAPAAASAGAASPVEAAPRPLQPLPPGSTIEAELLEAVRTNPTYKRLVVARAPAIASDGAVGRNKVAYSDAAAQRDVIWLAMRGLVTGSSEDIRATVRAMEYAFKNQAAKGNFNNTQGASAEKAVEADAFFLQAFGRIYLLVSNSEFRDPYWAELDALRQNLARAMQWLAANVGELKRQDRFATNRLFFDAIAFDLNGKILGDPKLRQIGLSFAEAGLANQRADGAFDEHNGADSSYQAVSMLNVAGLIAYADDLAFRSRLEQSLKRAADWEKTRIRPDGYVMVEGNSRTGLGQEEFMGHPKDVNYPEVALALLYASIIMDDSALKTQGEAVINYFATHIHPL